MLCDQSKVAQHVSDETFFTHCLLPPSSPLKNPLQTTKPRVYWLEVELLAQKNVPSY